MARSHWNEGNLIIRHSLSSEIELTTKWQIFAIDCKQEQYKWRKHQKCIADESWIKADGNYECDKKCNLNKRVANITNIRHRVFCKCIPNILQTYCEHHEYIPNVQLLRINWVKRIRETAFVLRVPCISIASANGDHIAQQGKSVAHQGPMASEISQTTFLIVLYGYLMANHRSLYLAPGAKWRRVTATFGPGSKLYLKSVVRLISLGLSRSANS